jgi:hypothetical protein
LDSYKKSYSLVEGRRWVSIQVGLPHGHIWNFLEVFAFVDYALKENSAPLPKVSELRIHDGRAWATVRPRSGIAKAELCYTTSTGPWPQRKWQNEAAPIENGKISVTLPKERPLVCFISVTDRRGLKVSTPHEELE